MKIMHEEESLGCRLGLVRSKLPVSECSISQHEPVRHILAAAGSGALAEQEMSTGDGENTQLDPLPAKGNSEQCTTGQLFSASLEESPFEYQYAEIDRVASVRAAIREGLDLKHGGNMNSWDSTNYNSNSNYNSGSNYSFNYRNYDYNNSHANINGNSGSYGTNYENVNTGTGNHLMYKYNNNNNNNNNNYNNRQNNRQNSNGNYKSKNKRMNQNQNQNQLNNNGNNTNYNGHRRYKNFNSFPDQQQMDQQNMLYNSMVGMKQTMDTSALNGGLSLGASPGNLLQQLQQQQQQQHQLQFMNKGIQSPQTEASIRDQGQNTHLLESFLFQQLSNQNQIQSPSCKQVQNPLETQLQSLGNNGGSMDSIFGRGTGFSNISSTEVANTSSLLPILNTTSQQQQQPISRTTTDSHSTSYSNSTSNSNSVSAPNSASNNENNSSSSNYTFQQSQLKPFKFDSLTPFNFQSLMDQPEISTPGSTITHAGSSLASLGSSIPSSSTNRENSLSFMSDMLDSNGTSTSMNLGSMNNTAGFSSNMTMVDPLESIWKRGHNTNSTISNSSNLVSTPGENNSKASDDFGMGTYVGNLNIAEGNKLEDIGLFGSYFS